MNPPGHAALRVRDLRVDFHDGRSVVRAVDGLDLDVGAGEVVGLVGESGCGKTVTALTALGLLPPSAHVRGGEVWVAGRNVLTATRQELRRMRGKQMGVVFQEALTSLHPSFTVGAQVAEAILTHEPGLTRRIVRARVIELLDLVGIPQPSRRMCEYPHQWSGGMRQRAMIAMAVANRPALLIADEPTTALDVTVQAQILELLADVRRRTGAAVLLITHDLGVVAETCDRVVVMREGRAVEAGDVRDVFASPGHPYTAGLLDAVPRIDAGAPPRPGEPPAGARPLLEVSGLVTEFRSGRRRLRAVDDVTLSVRAGETLAVVGESGSGKTTLARSILRLVEPVAGRVLLAGRDVTAASRGDLRRLRRDAQIVFQDPFASLNPRRRVGESVAQPLLVHRMYERAGGDRRIAELFELVGLHPDQRRRFPHELSGGQRQRVALARALSVSPRLLVLDEPVSSLDVATRARIIDLLVRVQRELGIAYLFISHDLAVVHQLADRVAVMYLGRIVETGTRTDVYARATHPYTRALLSAVPVPDPQRRPRAARLVLAGDPPDPADPPSGCRFRTRCWQATERCAVEEPALVDRGGHPSACHYAEDVPLRRAVSGSAP